MFFCRSCKEKKDWPGLFPSSYGKCEVCGQVAGCFDVPSRFLPMPKQTVTETYTGKHRA